MTLFIADALPGERVHYAVTRTHRHYAEAHVTSRFVSSPQRVTPRCVHFDTCGGCCLQHLDAAAQVVHKEMQLLGNLKRIGGISPAHVATALAGPAWGYRRRARLSVRYVPQKRRIVIGFREPAGPSIADLTQCEVLDPRIGTQLGVLARCINTLDAGRHIAHIEIAAAEAVVALVFRHLAPLSEADRQRLRTFGAQHQFAIYLQPGASSSTQLLWPDQCTLRYSLADHAITLAFQPADFIQINAVVNAAVTARVLELLRPQATQTVLDLFCGLGNFTLPLARHAAHVIGIEGDTALVAQARANAQANGIDNAEFHVADLGTPNPAEAWLAQRYDAVLLDPPRAGAEAMMPVISRLAARRVAYVSCHPATLARDAQLLVQTGYRFASAGIMDMFPHTAHVESLALFERF